MVQLKVGGYYRVNWFTKEKPEYGYLKVINLTENELVTEEINPWGGGPWIKKYQLNDRNYTIKNAEPMPDFKTDLRELAEFYGTLHRWKNYGR